jgi:hypothetical protein
MRRGDVAYRTCADGVTVMTVTSSYEASSAGRIRALPGARGVTMRGGQEGWALIERYGFNEPPELDAPPDDV